MDKNADRCTARPILGVSVSGVDGTTVLFGADVISTGMARSGLPEEEWYI